MERIKEASNETLKATSSADLPFFMIKKHIRYFGDREMDGGIVYMIFKISDHDAFACMDNERFLGEIGVGGTLWWCWTVFFR